MQPYENVIVVDVDGVLLYWEHGFHMWMVSNGYKNPSNKFYNIEDRYKIEEKEADTLIKSFNESAAMSRLPPMKDAMKYVKKLHEEHGFVLHCITAISNTRDMYNARLENLENLFGKTVVERLTLCGASENKPKFLEEYVDSECFWVEDLMENAIMGLKYGMKPLLIDHHYNKEHHNADVQRVNNWKEIYDIIIG